MLGILNQKFEFPGTHKISRLEFQADVLTHVYWALALILTLVTSIEKVCRSVKGCKKSFAMKCFVFNAHSVLFTVGILGASSYETLRANDTASILACMHSVKIVILTN